MEEKKYSYKRKTLLLPNGERKDLYAKTQEELDDKVMEIRILTRSGVDVCSEETFGHFAQMWYDIYKKPYLREKSLEMIRYILNQHILPVLGDYRLQDITPMQIQAIMAGLAKKSASLQSKVLINLRSIFKVAQENGLVVRSPVSSMLKPGGKKTQEKTALTPQESEKLLARVRDRRAGTFLMIALNTGLRRGEILALKWDDVDFEKKIIRVRRNAVLLRSGTTISDELKTNAGRRDVPLTAALEAHLAAEKERTHSQYILAMQNHQPLTQSSYKSMWRLIERELPEKRVTAHILRHTYITRLFEAGLDIKEIQYLAGHSSVDMTLRVYTHYDRASREQKTIDKVRAAL